MPRRKQKVAPGAVAPPPPTADADVPVERVSQAYPKWVRKKNKHGGPEEMLVADETAHRALGEEWE